MTEFSEAINSPPPTKLPKKSRPWWRRLVDSRILSSLALLFITLCALIASIGLVATNQERSRRLGKQDSRLAAQSLQIQQLQDQINCRARIIGDFDVARGRFTLSEGVVLQSNSAILTKLAEGVTVTPEDTQANENTKTQLAKDSDDFQKQIDRRNMTDKLCPPPPTTKP